MTSRDQHRRPVTKPFDPERVSELPLGGEPVPVSAEAPFRVVIVDDDEILSSQLAEMLKRNSLSVIVVTSVAAALQTLARERFDLAIIDVGLPDGSGFDICRTIRLQSDLPVMFLTALDSEPDRLSGFDVGADDYVVKPVSLYEVTSRVRALLRRWRRPLLAPVLEGPDELLLDRVAHRASAKGRRIHLTVTEFSILAFLLERRGLTASADEISAAVWGHETFGQDNYVQQHISHLRSKLRAVGAVNVIETVHGLGYVIL